jgi:hypothetical protein
MTRTRYITRHYDEGTSPLSTARHTSERAARAWARRALGCDRLAPSWPTTRGEGLGCPGDEEDAPWVELETLED